MLLAIVFRAAIPAGFMPTADATGHITFELCPGTEHQHPGFDAAQPGHHHHVLNDEGSGLAQTDSRGHEHHHSGDPARDHIPCLFAASAGCALVSAVLDSSTAADRVVACGEHPQAVFVATIVRAQLARAPPIPHVI